MLRISVYVPVKKDENLYNQSIMKAVKFADRWIKQNHFGKVRAHNRYYTPLSTVYEKLKNEEGLPRKDSVTVGWERANRFVITVIIGVWDRINRSSFTGRYDQCAVDFITVPELKEIRVSAVIV